MIAPETLSLLVTLRCDAKCDHCTVFGAPNRKERMPDELARSAIDQARRRRSIRLVAFTGGEPMLDYAWLRGMVAYAGRSGLQAGLVSNSSWALDRAQAESRMSELAALGLTTYITSIDEYHARHIDIRAVRHAVHAALARKVTVHINALWTPGYADTLARLPSVLELPGAVIDGNGRYGLHVWTSVPAARRKARSTWAGAPGALGNRAFAGRCDHILRHPIVAPDGALHACCGLADTTPFGPARFSRTGTLREASLATLLGRMQHNLLFNLLAHVGPNGLLERLLEEDASLPLPQGALNHCELCALLLKPPWVHALTRLLDRLTTVHDDARCAQPA